MRQSVNDTNTRLVLVVILSGQGALDSSWKRYLVRIEIRKMRNFDAVWRKSRPLMLRRTRFRLLETRRQPVAIPNAMRRICRTVQVASTCDHDYCWR